MINLMRWTQDDAAETRRLHVFSVHNDTLTAPELETVSSLLQNTKIPPPHDTAVMISMKEEGRALLAAYPSKVTPSIAEAEFLLIIVENSINILFFLFLNTFSHTFCSSSF
jgi:hypothetical protein